MKRRDCLFLFFGLAACKRSSRPLDEVLPPTPGEGWTLGRTIPLDVGSAPEIVRQLGLRRALRADYQGPGELTLTLYEMNAPAAAFELNQKWRPMETSAHFHHDRYFFVVESTSVGKPAILSFIRLLEQHLKSIS